MDNRKFAIVCIIIMLVSCTLGFFLGRGMVKSGSTINTVKYIKGEKITDTIEKPVPYSVFRPIDTANIIKQCVKDGIYSELFPEKIDIQYIEVTSEDTLAIIMDWASKRMYSEQLFDIDTVGKCTINATLQYNRISTLSYEYIPIEKQTTITISKVRLFSPYIGAGIVVEDNFHDYLNYMPMVTTGFFIKEKCGIGLQYGKSLRTKNNLFGASLLYKF